MGKPTQITTPVSVIKSKMRTGEIQKVADTTGYSAQHVSNVLAGRRTNAEILREANRITYRRKV